MSFEGRGLSEVVDEDLGVGKLFLMVYEQGTGGEFFLKQFFSEKEESSNNILITTNEDPVDIKRILSKNGMADDGEIFDLSSMMEDEMDRVCRKDKFVEDGILVTDLLDISTKEEVGYDEIPLDIRIMAKISTTAIKQVTPYRFVIDDFGDIISICPVTELKKRLLILRKSLRQNRGVGVLGILGKNSDLKDLMNVFDGILKMEVRKGEGSLDRYLVIKHLKNDLSVPKSLKVDENGNIPKALSIG